MNKFIAASVLLVGLVTYGQKPYEDQLDRMLQIPNSPEAMAFQKYGNTPVSLYTGTPNVQIPLHTFKGNELDLPIALTYDGTAIKVEQLATQVGLGWNLNVGGRISRITNGFPDDYNVSSPSKYWTIMQQGVREKIIKYKQERTRFTSAEATLEYAQFLEDLGTNKVDAQPDYYSLNVLGINDYIIFQYDEDGVYPRTLKNPRIKVEATFVESSDDNSLATQSLASWIVTHEDGTKFYFGLAEETEAQGNDTGDNIYGILKRYNSSWVLTKIESSNLKDIYEFGYLSARWNQPISVSGVSFASIEVNKETPDTTPVAPFYNFAPTYYITQQLLTSIARNGKQIVALDLGDRRDLDIDSAIETLNLYDGFGDDSDLLSKIHFDHCYFGNDEADAQEEEMRLQLKGIRIVSKDDSPHQDYTFEYHKPGDMPPTYSRAQDYMGHYNGIDNPVLYPYKTYGNYEFLGADRSPDADKANVGMLTKIIYPTKGYTEFEYEANTSPYDQTDANEEELSNVTYGTVSVSSGTDPNTTCGPCCQDVYPRPPKVVSTVFDIPQAGYYHITEFITNGGNITHSFLIRRSRTVLDNCSQPPLPYGQIIDMDDPYCATLPRGVVWDRQGGAATGSNGYTERTYLEPGCYQATVVVGDMTSNTDVTLKVWREEIITSGEVGEGALPRAGLRIARIRDYDGQNSVASSKRYMYLDELNGTRSSGGIHFRPHLAYFSKAVGLTPPIGNVNSNPCKAYDITFVNRIGHSSGGQQPHITYRTVYEIREGDSQNGHLKHEFYKGNSGIFSNGVPPNANFFANNDQAGRPRLITAKDNGGNTVSTKETFYDNKKNLTVIGFYVKVNPEKRFHAFAIRNLGNGYFEPFYTQARIGVYSSFFVDPFWRGADPVCGWTFPYECEDPNYDCSFFNKGAIYDLEMTVAQGSSLLVPTTRTTTVLDGEEMVTTQDNEYSGLENHYLLRRSTTVTSKGETIATEHTYPGDLEVPGSQDLVDKNNLVAQMATTVTLVKTDANGTTVETPVSKQIQQYSTVADNIVLPETLSVQKGTGATQQFFFGYYPNGNLKQTARENAPAVCYIWGYDRRYPIAKITNMTLAEVETAMAGLPTAYNTVAGIRALSDADDDRTLDTTDGNDNKEYVGREGALRQALDALRKVLPTAMVTTYTHDPSIGVTSITDPRGNTTYYDYDAFHKLSSVRDAQGHLLTDHTYDFAKLPTN
ncbi:MAG: RHS repeat domain-containing protein [Flavobacteriaceae bacterium]